MKLLAWDTSSKAGAIVALEWPAESASKGDEPASAGWESVRQAGEWSLNVDSQHSERLLWGIHQMLESARWKLEEIDAFAVGVGPGSFTGLRIGITTARTLAHALQKPLIGVSSLAALARPAALWLKSTERSDVLVVASTDACKGELFALWGRASSVAGCVQAPEEGEGLWKRDVRELVIAPEELMDAVKAKLKKDSAWLALGEGRSRYGDAWKMLPAKQELKLEAPFSDQVQGRYLGMLAWEAWQAQGLNKMLRDALSVHPRYVRASDAEIKLKSGVLKKAPSEVPASLLVGEKA